MPAPAKLQADFQQRADRTRAARVYTARSYVKGDWLDVAGTRQTYDRLVRKGHRNRAEQLLHLADRSMTGRPQLEPEPQVEVQLEEIGELVREAVIGVSDTLPVNFLHKGSQTAHSVGRIITLPGRAPNGTGFLISPRLLLTNNHVLADPSAARGNIVQFNFYSRWDNSPLEPIEFRFQPETFFLTNPVEDLDWCLVAVEPVNRDGQELAHFGWNNLIPELGKVQQGERLNIIHYPQGRPQEVSIRENFLALLLDRFLHYVTDTEPGSSGSPVFNEEWEVVGLHHAAREITDREEIELYLSVLHGIEPAAIENPARFGITINEGIRISQIVGSFKNVMLNLAAHQRPLLNEALRGELAPTDFGLPRPMSVATAPGAIVDSSGAATWTIPFNVSVNLGAGIPANVATPGPGQIAVAASSSQALTTQLEIYQDEINSQKSVFRALAFLQESREGPYLPSDQEIEANRQNYYGQIIADVQSGVTAAALYDALNALLSSTLNIVTAFPESLAGLESLNTAALESGLLLESAVQYARARAHLYTWADLQEDRMLRGIYTNVIIAPEQLMLKDLIVQLGQEDLLPQRFRNNQFLNCEHIVPQSWFDKAPIGVSDMHHLITADGAANNFRTDCAYRELDGAGEEGPDDRPPYIPAAGTRDFVTRRFEPTRGKAVVARATLYFLLAHKEFIDTSKYGLAEIEILKEWAKSEPPGPYELHRNEAIFQAQGNRNPLIDFPAWIDLIDFVRGLKVV